MILPKSETRFDSRNGETVDLFNGRIPCHLWLIGQAPRPLSEDDDQPSGPPSRDARGADAQGRDVRGREVWKRSGSKGQGDREGASVDADALRNHDGKRGSADIRDKEELPSLDLTGRVKADSPGAEMLANRLRKNLKHKRRWARRERISCYRVYDADLPEYAVAVDLYGDWAHVQEYQAPSSIDPLLARQRLQEVVSVIPAALGIAPEKIRVKVRRRGRGGAQYEKLNDAGRFIDVEEGGLRFQINLNDYLDSGLFLDHRLVRNWVRERAAGVDFLNLFAYTGSATVYAADGGAASTTTVDLSGTYLDWARRNMALNGFTETRHRYLREDCTHWIKGEKLRYGLILLDPPTFSNARRMVHDFDVQRDHVDLIRRTARLLSVGGTLIFSCNFRKFQLDHQALDADFVLQDRTRASIPEDFRRRAGVHHCWIIHKRA